MKGLPKQWWDTVLDGRVFEVDVRDLGYRGVNAFRCAVYQQADMRFRLAATHKSSPTTLVVQAWGAPGLSPRLPRLADAEQPPLQSPRIIPAQPTHQEQPPTMTVEPQLSAADMEALLGPCTCGQSPTCAPTCDRFK